MALMTRGQFNRTLEEGIYSVFGRAYKKHPEEWSKLFEIANSKKHAEEMVQNIGLDVAVEKPEGDAITMTSGQDGWNVRFIHKTYGLGFALSMEAIQDNLYMDLAQRYGKELARSMQHKKETVHANIFNNAFDNTYLGGDGKELCATDHPLFDGSTQANELATAADLSEESLEDILTLMEGCVDDRGKPMQLKGQKLLVHRNDMFVAHRIMNSSLRPGTALNDTNAIKDMNLVPGGVVVNHYLTDSDAWFVLSDCTDGLIHFKRMSVEKKVDTDPRTRSTEFTAVERYSAGWANWRKVWASAGAA